MTGDPVRRVADALRRRGLGVPARLLVDAHRPLAPLLSDLSAAAGPVLGAAFGPAADDVRSIADDERWLDRLDDELSGDLRADAG